MNVAGMIRRLSGKNRTVTRVDADGAYSTEDGTFQPGDTITFPVMASVQPATPDDLVSIPEGDRDRERFRVYALCNLNNVIVSKLRKSDLIDIDGVSYQVESVEHWPNHSKSIVVRVNTDAN